MENLALIALAAQLKSAMANFTIRRVVQHQPHGFIFQTGSAKLPALKVLMNPSFPALYASESKPPLAAEGSDFLMVLRKHLTSAELVEFRKPLSERILEFEFKTVVPSKELAVMTLVLELIPNTPNIILLDMERRVLASYLPITPQHEIAEYAPYTTPAIGNKITLERIQVEDLPEIEECSTKQNPAQWLVSHVAGLGPVFADEVVYRQQKSGQSMIAEIRLLLDQLTRPSGPSGTAWIYTELPLSHVLDQNDLRLLDRAIVSPMELQSLERTHSSRTFNTLLEAARFYFDEMESRMLLERAKLPLLRELRTAGKRLVERERKLGREQKKYEEAQSLHKTAQMLTASGMKMDQRYDKAEVTNYYGDEPRAELIDLDSAITLRENIDRMFKRHHKAGRGRLMVDKQLGNVRNRVASIQEQTRRLNAIRDWDTWLAIEKRIKNEKGSATPSASTAVTRPNRFRSVTVDGREIFVGRSSRENDELTFQMAAPDDFWLHAGDYSGSHVVIRNPGREKDPPENVLTKAAQLAAYFSQARNSSKVEVHYTRRKHVSKPRKAKPGLVRILEFKSIAVEPRNWLEE